MPRDGAIIFADPIGKLDLMRVACDKCGRDGSYGSSACTEVAKLAIQIGKIAMYAKRIRCPRTLSGQHGAARSVPERVAKGYRQDDVRFAPESALFLLAPECLLCAQ